MCFMAITEDSDEGSGELGLMASEGTSEEELDQFEKNKVWELTPKTLNESIVGTKWVYRNKLNKFGQVARNKARLVVQCYSQQEGIDYEENFAHVARYQSAPKESHMTAVKRIIKYLIGTIDYGLWYKILNVFNLIGFSYQMLQVIKLTGKAQVERANYLENLLYLGTSRNNIVLPYLLLK
uniref:Uncharacterized protein LOC104225612 n=1 Tax=Nicotiana sylvestris TaxID=4096 RepID=A0A1U7W6V3_NICSY|nr:PREDICTED: uncharacterized protein LOC104225612 [Nicotiana sylvestris]